MIKKVLKHICLIWLVPITAGITLCITWYNNIQLPLDNTNGIISPLISSGYNPSNNIIKYLFWITIPILISFSLYICLRPFKNHNNPIDFRFKHSINNIPEVTGLLLLICYAIIGFTIKETYHSAFWFDEFHEGESLGIATNILHGDTPYKDIIFLHGWFQDPGRSIIAFQLLGKSISSVKILESLVDILTGIILVIYLFFVFKKNVFTTFISLSIVILLTLLPYSHFYFVKIIIPSRDICTFTFLLITSLLFKLLTEQTSRNVLFYTLLLLCAYVPIASFAYSIDRAFYLSAASFFTLILLIIYHSDSIKNCFVIISLYSFGILGGFLTVYAVLQEGFSSFINFTFYELHQFKDLFDGLELDFREYIQSLHFILLPINLIWLYQVVFNRVLGKRNFFINFKKIIRDYHNEIILIVLSILFFRSAIGRTDWEHIQYNGYFSIISTLIVSLKYISPYLNLHHSVQKIGFYTLYTSGIGILIGVLISTSSLKEKLPFGVSDDTFINEKQRECISYLKDNLNDSENFYTLNSIASWYYYLDKPSPSKYSIVWFAATQSQQKQVVEELKDNNVKFILYNDDSIFNKLDDFDFKKRIPIIMEYIHSQYQFHKQIDNTTLWLRKDYDL